MSFRKDDFALFTGKGIIITGVYCAGQTDIAKRFQEAYKNDFEVTSVATTNKKYNGRFGYCYTSENDFNSLSERKMLKFQTVYLGDHYGITKDDYKKLLSKDKKAILVLPPDLAFELIEKHSEYEYMVIFVDALDSELSAQYEEFRDDFSKSSNIDQRSTDRSYKDRAAYIIYNNKQDNTVELLQWLYEHWGEGGGLPSHIISLMFDCGMLLGNTSKDKIKGASYDLLLGDEYYYAGEIKKLSDSKPFLTIEPYDYAIVSCNEIAKMPRDVVAKFGLSVGLFCQGVILSNGPQIDPGFRGTLFCLLFNTSNQPVHLKRGKHYATIEFNKLVGLAPAYEGKYQDKTSIIEYIPANALHGAINELKEEIERLKRESRTMQNIYIGVVALMFSILSILLIVR